MSSTLFTAHHQLTVEYAISPKVCPIGGEGGSRDTIANKKPEQLQEWINIKGVKSRRRSKCI
jgi:hypothetical protein